VNYIYFLSFFQSSVHGAVNNIYTCCQGDLSTKGCQIAEVYLTYTQWLKWFGTKQWGPKLAFFYRPPRILPSVLSFTGKKITFWPHESSRVLYDEVCLIVNLNLIIFLLLWELLSCADIVVEFVVVVCCEYNRHCTDDMSLWYLFYSGPLFLFPTSPHLALFFPLSLYPLFRYISQHHVHESNRYQDLDGFMKTFPCSPPPDSNYGVYALDCEMVNQYFIMLKNFLALI